MAKIGSSGREGQTVNPVPSAVKPGKKTGLSAGRSEKKAS